MIYKHYSPVPELAPYIDCFWVLQASARSGASSRARMPADSRATMLLNFLGDTHLIAGDGLTHSLAIGANLLGPHTQSYLLEHSGNTELIAVQFRPGGLAWFMRSGASELAEQATPLDLLWGRSGNRLCEQIYETGTNIEKVALFQSVLLKRFTEVPHQRRIMDALAQIEHVQSKVTVEWLAKRSNLSQKQFERLFEHMVGMMPKRYIRLARFQKLVGWLMHHSDAENWTSLAVQFGYYDHSHLAKDFQTFVGTAPHEFASATSGIVEVMYGNQDKSREV